MDHETPPDNDPGTADTACGGIVCALCGTARDRLPLTWTCSVENGTQHYLCEACARTHLRSIEGRLDPTWW
ncbi:hypothetical protein [Wenjunlia tyrosinilytica]|uniref:Uncharacterized protein n=1 Tax=Wenjunlia tyrosinilytica TaxID=1544741 RepID=A0A918DWJ0_9ACTN|nr:hypothetical protein [Wenjunlia tyrosinilytica]GGO85751.1 hypothetical protein GCM10012280_20260 [Wenjunlia tyrosinilytica]